mmetsp:Transcript_34483/g.50060  ORF Transcript_34483/g.50060 Transcript_34483/m.50060 type:complete len:280 (-) Transcript_34483:92-931(-)|eukprot:CAMPEP_0116028042 /NCGR_PEP_ID=MMETSP0321-20121206/15119_1 /TAXON_ID=163516 /ORGANISM="Leptocylindrus danicus var. danicus, Strain B650" /LENGTH=279 /DNA_ID=CAMNT_0003501773 /DNA_START=59 /DNA_END=898 /DNA_ORIENTATION=+
MFNCILNCIDPNNPHTAATSDHNGSEEVLSHQLHHVAQESQIIQGLAMSREQNNHHVQVPTTEQDTPNHDHGENEEEIVRDRNVISPSPESIGSNLSRLEEDGASLPPPPPSSRTRDSNGATASGGFFFNLLRAMRTDSTHEYSGKLSEAQSDDDAMTKATARCGGPEDYSASPLRLAHSFSCNEKDSIPTISLDEFVMPGSDLQQAMSAALKAKGSMGDMDDECVICMEGFSDDNPRMPTLCGCGENKTYFHLPCLLVWIDKNDTCPSCREKLTWEEF